MDTTESRGAAAALAPVGWLFDLDGVLTPTVDIHMAAWEALFAPFLAERGAKPYTRRDYFAFVDGRPRYDGVRELLGSRGIRLPEGSPDDDPSAETVCGLGNRKNAEFTRQLAEHGIAPYPGSRALLDAIRSAGGRRIAVVTSSKNGEAVLEAAGLRADVEVLVDGVVAAAEHLAGKPAPATYHEAARRLGLADDECVVVEDALSGVEAGRAGAFGLVIGVDRGVGADALIDHGATLVVDDLVELVPVFAHTHTHAGEGDGGASGAATGGHASGGTDDR